MQQLYPGLLHISGGDVARIATADEARTSPLLNSIGRQLGDRRRRPAATRRLARFVTEVLADALRDHQCFLGMVVNGVRTCDLADFETAHGSRVVCVLQLVCSEATMLARLGGRGGRAGDERLGIADGSGDDPVARALFNQFQTKDRVTAYIDRLAADEAALRAHFRDAYAAVVRSVDAEIDVEACGEAAAVAFRSAAAAQGAASAALLASAGAGAREDGLGAHAVVWQEAVRSTAARMDAVLHPDGRPRAGLA